MAAEIEISELQKNDLTGLKALYKDAFESETDYDKMLNVFSLVEKMTII